MYKLNKDNLTDTTLEILGSSEFERHAMYALDFMVENIHTELGVGDAYISDGSDLSSGLFQKLIGNNPYYLGFVDLHEGLTAIAKGFAGELFEDDREFILDSTGEFINRINGEFVINSASAGVTLDMEPQLFLEEDEVSTVIKPVSILHIPVTIGDSGAEMLFIKI